MTPAPAPARAVFRAVSAKAQQANPIRRIPQPSEEDIRSTWRQAAVPRIERMLQLAKATDAGGWHVAAAACDVPQATSVVRLVNGREIALWRDDSGTVHAGAGSCPHMGALLENCESHQGDVLCRWHGLRLPSEWPGEWPQYPAYDDGVLVWVRVPTEAETFSDRPRLAERANLESSIVSMFTQDGRCEPDDVIANRLDPWHGAWFHPYAFSHLTVNEDLSTDDCLVTDVTFRLNRTYGIPVRAQFTCADSRTITMTITDGEGVGSTVETHATLLRPASDDRPALTRIHEATIAYSPRRGFAAARHLGALIRPLMVRTQSQLWVDDLEYAERRYELRSGHSRW